MEEEIIAQPGAVPAMEQPESVLVVQPEKIQDAPTEPDKLAQKWQKRISKAKKHWQWFYDRCRYNRKLVANFNEKVGPDNPDFMPFRINLIASTIRGIMPNLYARNPEISIKSRRPADEANEKVVKFCDTLEEVLNAYLEKAELKTRGKAVVRAALTCSYGVLKVCFQRDLSTDPIIQSRLQDAQDNLQRIDGLASRLADDDAEGLANVEALRQEMEETVRGYQQDAEPQQLSGLVIDRIPTDQLIIDPTIRDFDDYDKADWMCQCVPMSRGYVEETYKVKIPGAAVYEESKAAAMDSAAALVQGSQAPSEDDEVMVWEIWDKQSQRVYTMVDGCPFFLRDPVSPQKVGGRWYPFFLLPFDQVSDKFVAPSLVDLMEGLQDEHNKIRDAQEKHRDFCKPGYLASADVDEKSIGRFASAELGEITILKNADGQNIGQMIMPKQYPPMDSGLYDTSAVRQDIEQVTGMQDAMRSTVVQPKTATEAQIMQQGLSGRVSAFRDQVEDFIQQIAQYSAQILLQELKVDDVREVMGYNPPIVDPITGASIEQQEQPYEWPQLSLPVLSRLIKAKIEAGSTGAPNKLQEQENWGKALPTVMQLVQLIYQTKMQGMDSMPLETLLSETCRRYDDRIDPKSLIPQMNNQQLMMQQMAAQQAAGGQVPVPEVAQDTAENQQNPI
nr:MAG TPA: portal protein [Caudoviricetes sp.]